MSWSYVDPKDCRGAVVVSLNIFSSLNSDPHSRIQHNDAAVPRHLARERALRFDALDAALEPQNHAQSVHMKLVLAIRDVNVVDRA